MKLQRMQFGKSSEKPNGRYRTYRSESAHFRKKWRKHWVSNMTRHCHSPCGSLQPTNRYRPHFSVNPGSSGRKRNAVRAVVVNSVYWHENRCPSCGRTTFHSLLTLEFISSAFKVIETQCPKLACCRCDYIVQAPVRRCPWRSDSRTVRIGKTYIHRITAVCFRPMLTVVTGRYTNSAE